MTMLRTVLPLLAALVSGAGLAGCSSTGTPSDQRPAPSPDASGDGGTSTTGLQELAGLVHVHTPFSHDACDGQGLIDGQPNADCRAQLRQALCAARLDFAMLTDHPSHMREHAFEELLLFDDSSDELLLDSGGPIANRMHCPSGHSAILTVGYEGSPHTMPLGLEHHLDAQYYDGLDESSTADGARALIDALEGAGAVTAIAHSEDDDISDQLIVDSGLDAMEWYNVHGNIQRLLGGDAIAGSAGDVLDILGDLQDFMPGSSAGANADLVYLMLLASIPAEGFEKWQRVQSQRPVTGLLGSDVHQNVTVDAICDREDPLEQLACVAAAEGILPDSMHSLITGGPILLSDGDRIDSYGRVLRWLHNRVLVDEPTPAAIKSALRQGRSYGVFSVFGEPTGFSFYGVDANGAQLSMGDSAPGRVTLHVDLPSALQPVPGATSFTGADLSEIGLRLVIRRLDGSGSEVVLDDSNPSEKTELLADAGGAYAVELWITPAHLEAGLGSQRDLAEREYLWILTNPIRVGAP